MTAAIFHVTIEQGSDFEMPIAFTDGAGTPIDLTGCSAAMMIRRGYDDASPLVSLASPAAGIVIGAVDGTIAISIDAAVTTTLAAGAAVYDIRLTDSLGNPVRLLQGNVTISAAVTR